MEVSLVNEYHVYMCVSLCLCLFPTWTCHQPIRSFPALQFRSSFYTSNGWMSGWDTDGRKRERDGVEERGRMRGGKQKKGEETRRLKDGEERKEKNEDVSMRATVSR